MILSFIDDNGVVSLYDNSGCMYQIGKNHPEYQYIIDCCSNDDESVFDILIKEEYTEEPGVPIVVNQEEIDYKGVTIRSTYVKEVVDKLRKIGDSVLEKFLDRMILNPNIKSIEMLMDFLRYNCLPITENGMFLAYKSVRGDYKDWHSSRYSNIPGSIIEMPRDQVAFNPNVHCSYGFHVGTYSYADGFYNSAEDRRIVICLIDPCDVVSVPNDCDCQKLRTWRYKVIGDFEQKYDDRFLYSVEGDQVTFAGYVADVKRSEMGGFKFKFSE
jgi:hypothetical protein